MKNNVFYFLDCALNSIKFNGLINGLFILGETLYFKFNPIIHSNRSMVLGMKFNYLNRASIVYLLYDLFCSGTYYFKTNKKAPFILDIGANIGDSVLYFKWLYPNATIHAFEPHKSAYLLLQKNVNDNKFKNVSLYNFGIGKDKKETVLYSSNDNTFYASSVFKSVINKKEKISKNYIDIKNISTMDIFKNVRSIDLIKMDIEGGEMNALQGIKSLFKKTKCIILEYHILDKLNLNSFDEIVSLFKKNNFQANIFGSYRTVDNSTNPFVFFIKAEKITSK